MININKIATLAIAAIALSASSQAHNPFQPEVKTLKIEASNNWMDGWLSAGTYDQYTWTVDAGDWSVSLAGSGPGADFDLYIYDYNTGRLIDSDEGSSNSGFASFYAHHNGAKAIIRISNNGVRSGSYSALLEAF